MLIKAERSIIPACDVDVSRYEEIVRATANIPQIGAYKIGAALALSAGLKGLVEIARRYTSKPLIYDHQKAGTDIPETGKLFTETIKRCGIDALIIFPLSGPASQTAWIQSAQEIGLPIIVGGYMTHERFLVSDGGYVDDTAVERIYKASAVHGISDYVVPGNKPDVIKRLRELLVSQRIDPVFYAPGFIAQGGTISEAAKVAGPRWHAIVGRALYEAQDIAKTAVGLLKNLGGI